jgi:hypothetical protein
MCLRSTTCDKSKYDEIPHRLDDSESRAVRGAFGPKLPASAHSIAAVENLSEGPVAMVEGLAPVKRAAFTAQLTRALDGAWLRRRWIYRCVTAAVIVGFMLCVLYPLLWSRWALIDDHQLIEFYDSSPSHGPLWFLRTVLDSEVVRPGGGSRYRPVYYFLRIAETGLLQGNARFWWWSHTALFTGSIVTVTWALRRLTGIWENLLAAAWLVATVTWWGDIYCRLGPAEAYVVPGLALYAWGAVSAVSTLRWTRLPRYHLRCAVLIALGGIVAAGSKENMAFLAMPSIYIAARAGFRGSRRRLTIACIVHVAFTAFVFIAAYIGVANHGHVYLEDVSTSSRFAVVMAAAKRMGSNAYPWLIAGSTIASALVIVTWRRGRHEQARALIRPFAVAVAMLAFLALSYLSQVAFYGAWPPREPRYLFPGALAAPIAIYVCYWTALRAARIVGTPASWLAIGRLIAIVLVAWTVVRASFPVHASAVTTHRETLAMQKKVRRVVKAALAQPDVPVIFVSNHVGYYEVVHAVQLFLRHGGVRNTFYLQLRGYDSTQFAEGSLHHALTRAMEQMAREGGARTGGYSQTSPYAYDGGPCIGVGFGGETGIPACPAVVTF